MVRRATAWVHAWGIVVAARGRERRGQGTVEYVGTVVMVTLLIAGVGAAAKGWAPDVGAELRRGLLRAVKRLTGEFSA
jgi:CHASE2 domain-containing sensor protein